MIKVKKLLAVGLLLIAGVSRGVESVAEATYAVTGPDEDGVYTVTLQEDVIGPVMIPDNLGKVKIDLDGHTITGPDGETGSATEAGTSG